MGEQVLIGELGVGKMGAHVGFHAFGKVVGGIGVKVEGLVNGFDELFIRDGFG